MTLCWSRYNHFVENDKGELLLYNALQGTQHMLKVPPLRKEELEKAAVNPGLLSDKVQKQLKDTGYLVQENIDESQYLKLQYLSYVADSCLELILLPTEQCNFRCPYCYENFENGKMSDKVQENLISFVEKNIPNYGSMHVSWFGGEPLLALDIIEKLSEAFIDICKRNRKTYSASMTTNGYLLSDETLAVLYRLRVFHYQITIDGTREIHNRQRPAVDGSETFDVIVNNLLNVKKNKKFRFLSITIRTNFTKDTLPYLEEYLHFLYENFNEDDRFTFSLRPVADLGGERIKKMNDALYQFSDHIFYKKLEQVCGEFPLRYLFQGSLSPRGGICYAGKQNSYTVNSQGGIFRCTCDLYNEEHAQIGELSKVGFEIDEYKKSLWLSQMFSCGKKKCFFAPVCFGDSCPDQRIKNGRTLCPMEKRNIDSILRILDKTTNLFTEMEF